MQVNSISSASMGVPNRELLEAVSNASDKDLRRVALNEAHRQTHTKRHRNVERMMFWAIPVAAGVAAVVRNPAKVAKLASNGTVSNRLANIKTFAATATGWAATFGLIDLGVGIKNKLSQKSATVRKFDKEHPFMSVAATIAGTIGLIFGAVKMAKPVGKLLSKVKISDDFAKKGTSFLEKVNEKLNASKVINKIADVYHKTPSVIKEVTKGAIDYMPMTLAVGSLLHTMNHASVLNKTAANNYQNLKEKQAEVKEFLKVLDKVEADRGAVEEAPENVEE